jgi:poly(3-hydroxybutyrate) depolymerase
VASFSRPDLSPLLRLVAGLRYAEGARRDRRLDLLRGYCVVAMTVDHLDAPTWLYLFTGGNRFFVSAAEGFLFISGLVMGIVYRPIAESKGLWAAALKAWRRALFLYCVTVGATLGFMWVSSRLGLPWAAGVDLQEAWWPVITLRRTFYLTDVLLLYTFLVGVAPAALALLRHGLWPLLMAVSWSVWVAHQLNPIELPWPSEAEAFFYIAAWQVLFITALTIGWHRHAFAERFGRLMSWRSLALCAAGLGGFLVVYQHGSAWLGHYYADGGQVLTDAFAKWSLPPARLLACACVFGLAFQLATYAWRPIAATLGHLLLPLGQSALTAYVLHLGVVALLTDYRQEMPSADITNEVRGSVFLLFGILFLFFGVSVWEGLRRAIARASSEQALRRRVDPVLIGGTAAVLATAVVVAPLPAHPIAGLVHLRDDRNTIDEPRYALHLPPNAVAEQPLPVLVVLHDADDDAETFGQELLGLADREGWLLVAPQLAYESDHLDPEVVAAESPKLVRGLRDVMDELARSTGLRLRRRALLFGYGRGAALAERYALARPNDVRAVALLGGANYTLPPLPDGSDPPFPFGSAGFPARRGLGVDADAVKRVWFWVGVGSQDDDHVTTSRAWDQYLGVTRVDRARALVEALRQAGADAELEVFSGAGHRINGEMRLAVADFSRRVRATAATQPPRIPPNQVIGSR